jgi:hypothetical protein
MVMTTSALTNGSHKLLAVPEEDNVKEGSSKTPYCASRSTSVGSSSSLDKSSGRGDISSPDGTPEQGYCAARDWSAPVFVRNTFLDTPPGIPQSLMGFFQEREIHSCPASGIGAPPGLELAETGNETPEAWPSSAAKLASCFSADSTGYSSDSLGLPEYDYPVPFDVAVRSGPAADSTPKAPVSSFNAFFQPCSIRTFTNSGMSVRGLSGICELTPGEDPKVENVPLAGPPQRPAAAAAAAANSEAAHLARLVETLRAENEMLKASLSGSESPAKKAIIARPEADSSPEWATRTSPVHPAPTEIAPLFLEPSLIPPPPLMQADSCVLSQAVSYWSVQATPLSQAVSAEGAAPSVGSAGHYSGQCKPCVHFHKKGCRNGTQCPFCHLCDADEVKRRQSRKCTRKQWVGLAFQGRC